jgi:hypothetical protein
LELEEYGYVKGTLLAFETQEIRDQAWTSVHFVPIMVSEYFMGQEGWH